MVLGSFLLLHTTSLYCWLELITYPKRAWIRGAPAAASYRRDETLWDEVPITPSKQTVDLWHIGQSVLQSNGSFWALASGYRGAGNGLSALEEQQLMEQVVASSLYILGEGSLFSSALTPTLPPKPGWGELLAWRFPKKIEGKVAGSGWVSQGVSPGDMVGTTFS